jgi:hypothetical protein
MDAKLNLSLNYMEFSLILFLILIFPAKWNT